MGCREYQMRMLAINSAGLYKEFPNPPGDLGERELDGRMMGIEHKEKSQIRSLLPDSGSLSPAVEKHLDALGIAVMPLLGVHFGT